jgi:hypothetical protein
MPGQDVQATITTGTTFVFSKHTLKVGAFFNHGRDIEGKFGSLAAGSSVYGGLSFCTSSTFPLDSKNVFANQLLGNFCSYGESNTRHDLRSLRYIFEVQRDVGHGMIADVKYVGTLGRHLAGPRTINALPFGARFLPQNQDPTNPGFALPDNLIRPLPGWGNISITERRNSSNYNALQATLNRQYSQNLQFGIAYTFSKSMDYGSDDRGFTSGFMSIPNFLPQSRNYGKSSFDQTHIFVANWQYNLPSLKSRLTGAFTKGWQLSGVFSASSGQPQSIFLVALTDYLGGGDAGRVNLTCNPALPRDQRTVEKYWNTSCVSLPARGDVGNAPKDVYRGPGRNNWDMTLFRNFRLGSEERVLTFRWEVYNLFNHTQFTGIDNTVLYLAAGPAIMNVNPTFGQALNAAPARQMQFSLRVRF